MKRSVFQDRGIYVEHTRQRTGPPNLFVCCYKGKAWYLFEPKEVLKAFRLSKGTPSRERLEEWLAGLDTDEEPVSPEPEQA